MKFSAAGFKLVWCNASVHARKLLTSSWYDPPPPPPGIWNVSWSSFHVTSFHQYPWRLGIIQAVATGNVALKNVLYMYTFKHTPTNHYPSFLPLLDYLKRNGNRGFEGLTHSPFCLSFHIFSIVFYLPCYGVWVINIMTVNCNGWDLLVCV